MLEQEGALAMVIGVIGHLRNAPSKVAEELVTSVVDRSQSYYYYYYCHYYYDDDDDHHHYLFLQRLK